jgi:LPS-assembly lipoprotein
MNARVFLTLLTSLAVSGCGFQPLYASGTGVSPALSSVEVVTPPTRTGQLLREELDDELARASGDAPRYRLTVDIEERRIARGLRIDDTANRYELRTLLAYQLVDLASGRVVYRNSRPVTVTYDIADAAYAGVSASLDGTGTCRQ